MKLTFLLITLHLATTLWAADDYNHLDPRIMDPKIVGLNLASISATMKMSQVEAKVLKAYIVKDGNAVFRAYVAMWKNQEVVVSDTPGSSDLKEGDTIKFMAMRMRSPTRDEKENSEVLAFIIVPKIPVYHAPHFTVDNGQWQDKPKQPYYVDCWPDSVVLLPGSNKVTWAELQQPTNAVEKCLDDVQQRNRETYVIVIARPDSDQTFRQVRKMIAERSIDCGYSILASNVPLDLYNQPLTQPPPSPPR